MNLPVKKKQTYRHREQTCGCRGEGKWEGWSGNWGCKMQMQVQIITYRTDKQQGPTV